MPVKDLLPFHCFSSPSCSRILVTQQLDSWPPKYSMPKISKASPPMDIKKQWVTLLNPTCSVLNTTFPLYYLAADIVLDHGPSSAAFSIFLNLNKLQCTSNPHSHSHGEVHSRRRSFSLFSCHTPWKSTTLILLSLFSAFYLFYPSIQMLYFKLPLDHVNIPFLRSNTELTLFFDYKCRTLLSSRSMHE